MYIFTTEHCGFMANTNNFEQALHCIVREFKPYLTDDEKSLYDSVIMANDLSRSEKMTIVNQLIGGVVTEVFDAEPILCHKSNSLEEGCSECQITV